MPVGRTCGGASLQMCLQPENGLCCSDGCFLPILRATTRARLTGSLPLSRSPPPPPPLPDSHQSSLARQACRTRCSTEPSRPLLLARALGSPMTAAQACRRPPTLARTSAESGTQTVRLLESFCRRCGRESATTTSPSFRACRVRPRAPPTATRAQGVKVARFAAVALSLASTALACSPRADVPAAFSPTPTLAAAKVRLCIPFSLSYAPVVTGISLEQG